MKKLLTVLVATLALIAGCAAPADAQEECIVQQEQSCWYEVGCDLTVVYLVINEDEGFNLSYNEPDENYISFPVEDGMVFIGDYVECDMVTDDIAKPWAYRKAMYR